MGEEEEFSKPLYDTHDVHHTDDDMQRHRSIIHIDIDCFYAQVEMIRNPRLRDQPMGVQQKHLMVTCNYVARQAGVKKTCWIHEALKVCPQIVLVNGEDLYHYRKMSQEIFKVIRSFKCPVEKLGLDENFIDVTDIIEKNMQHSSIHGHTYKNENEIFCKCGCNNRLKQASKIAKDIRDKLFRELGVTSSAGISYNKTLAKLVGGQHKPNDQTLLFPCDVQGFLTSLPHVGKIPNIGSKLTKLLKENNIENVIDLQQVSIEFLERFLDKETACRISNLSKGVDHSVVKLSEKALSIGLEDRFKMISTRQECEDKLKWLLSRLCILIHEDGRLPQTIKVTIRDFLKISNHKFYKESRQCKINSNYFKPLQSCQYLDEKNTIFIMNVMKELLNKMLPSSDQAFHLTLMGISVSDFVSIEKRASIQSFFKKSTNQTSCQANLYNTQPSNNDSGLESSQGKFSFEKSPCSSSKSDQSKTNHLNCHQQKRKLPDGWDSDVFAQLPPDIQNELLKPHERNMCNKPSKKKKVSIKDFLT